MSIHRKCETCKDRASCPILVNENGNAYRCPIFNDWSARRAVSSQVYGDPDRKIKTFFDLEYHRNNIEKQVTAIRNFLKMGDRLLILISPNGTGKTHIMQAISYDILISKKWSGKNKIGCFYIDSKTLRDTWVYRDRGQDYDYRHHNRLQFIESARVLLIDELGGEGEAASDHFEKNFCQMLSRHEKIVIASNKEMPDIFRDNRTLSRLSEALVIRWTGKDYRNRRIK